MIKTFSIIQPSKRRMEPLISFLILRFPYFLEALFFVAESGFGMVDFVVLLVVPGFVVGVVPGFVVGVVPGFVVGVVPAFVVGVVPAFVVGFFVDVKRLNTSPDAPLVTVGAFGSSDEVDFRVVVIVLLVVVDPRGVTIFVVVVDRVVVVEGVRFLTSLVLVVRGTVDDGVLGDAEERGVVVDVVGVVFKVEVLLGATPLVVIVLVVVIDLGVVVVLVVVRGVASLVVVVFVPYNLEYTSPDRSRVIFGCDGVRTMGELLFGAREVLFFVVVVVP